MSIHAGGRGPGHASRLTRPAVAAAVGQQFAYTTTADPAKISNAATLTNFVTLLNEEPLLRDAPQIFHPTATGGAQDDGRDIRVFAADGTTALAFDLREFSKNARAIKLWVKFPTFNAANSTIVVKWGDSALSAIPAAGSGGRNETWNNYLFVLGLSNLGDLTDMTGNARDATATVTGSVTVRGDRHPFKGGWIDFKNAYYTLANTSGLLNAQANVTLQAVVNNDIVSGTNQTSNAGGIVGNRIDGTWGTNHNQLLAGAGSTALTGQVNDGSVGRSVNITNASYPRGLSRQYAIAWDSASLVPYIDGVAGAASTTAWSDGVSTNNALWRIGMYFGASNWFDGLMCEVRARGEKLSADFLKTEWNNQWGCLAFWPSGDLTEIGTTSITPITAARSTASMTSAWPTTTVCTIPAVEGTTSPIHPKVLDTVALGYAGGWNGKRYWMAFTPYPVAGGDLYENPCVCCSDDGTTWTEPVGLTNPISPVPVGYSSTVNFNSDTHVQLVSGTMYVFWRHQNNAATALRKETVEYKSSTDGVNWSALSYTNLDTRYQVADTTSFLPLTSMAIVHQNGKWRAWGNNGSAEPTLGVSMWQSDSVTGPWRGPFPCTIPTLPDSHWIWHLDVEPYGDGYYLLAASSYTGASFKSGRLYVMTSDERGLTFGNLKELTTLSPYGQYRSCLVRKDDDTGWDVWVSNMTGTRGIERMSVTDPA